MFQITDNDNPTNGKVQKLSAYCAEHCTTCKESVDGGKYGTITLCNTGEHEILWEIENVLKSDAKSYGSDARGGYGSFQAWADDWQNYVPVGVDLTGTIKANGNEYKVGIPKHDTIINSYEDYIKVPDPIEASNIYNWIFERSWAIDYILPEGKIAQDMKSGKCSSQKDSATVQYWQDLANGTNNSGDNKDKEHLPTGYGFANKTTEKKFWANYWYNASDDRYFYESEGVASGRSRGAVFCEFYQVDSEGNPCGNKLGEAYKIAKALNIDILDAEALRNSKNPDDEIANGVGNMLGQLSFYSEADLMAYCKLNELDINSLYLSDAKRDNLTGTEVKSLTGWEQQVQKLEEESGFLKSVRISLMVLGIVMSVYFVFLYLAYWVDRINNFVDVEFLKLLTFNKLTMSEDEEECTYSIKSALKAGTKTVNHRAIIKVTIVGELFAVLLITGAVYKLVLWIIALVSQLLDGVGK